MLRQCRDTAMHSNCHLSKHARSTLITISALSVEVHIFSAPEKCRRTSLTLVVIMTIARVLKVASWLRTLVRRVRGWARSGWRYCQI